jgi:hypothetical protein
MSTAFRDCRPAGGPRASRSYAPAVPGETGKPLGHHDPSAHGQANQWGRRWAPSGHCDAPAAPKAPGPLRFRKRASWPAECEPGTQRAAPRPSSQGLRGAFPRMSRAPVPDLSHHPSSGLHGPRLRHSPPPFFATAPPAAPALIRRLATWLPSHNDGEALHQPWLAANLA